MWKAVLVAASGLLASPPAAADAVLHVDCALGDDAADGMTPQTPFRTIGRALDQLGEETGEVRIAAGTCPGEGGLRLGSRAALVGAGSSATRVHDELVFGTRGCVLARHVNLLRGLALLGARDEAPGACNDLSLRLEDVRLARVLRTSAWDRVGLRVERSALPGVHATTPINGIGLTYQGSVVGWTEVLTGSDSTILVDDTTLGSLHVNGTSAQVSVRIRRCTFPAVGTTGAAVVLRGGNRPSFLVTDSVFLGHTHAVDAISDEGVLDFSHNTVVGQLEGALRLDLAGLRLYGNVFAEIPGPAVSLRAPAAIEAASWNDFHDTGAPLCLGSSCLSTVGELNLEPFAEENLDLRPRFVSSRTGDLRLSRQSPLVDAGPPPDVARSTLDRDGRTRPQDGDGDGEAVHDIGAYERPSIR